jgi:hypothetical protein
MDRSIFDAFRDRDYRSDFADGTESLCITIKLINPCLKSPEEIIIFTIKNIEFK